MFVLADSPVVARVTTAVDAALAVDLPGLPDEALAGEIAGLVGARDRLSAAIAERVARFRKRDLAQADGAASTRAWLRGRLRLADRDAARLVALGDATERLPRVAEALRTGRLTADNALLVRRGVADLNDPAAVSAVETLLVREASGRTPEDFRGIVTRVRDTLLPDLVAHDAESVYERRAFFASPTLEDVVALNGSLAKSCGELLLALLGPLSEPNADDTRTAAQRRHDAFEEILRLAAAGKDLPITGGQRPHLTLVVNIADLQEQLRGDFSTPGLAAATGGPGLDRYLRTPPRFETTGDTDWLTALSIACDAALTRVVLGGDDAPINLGRETRTWSPAQRRLISMRDRCCTWAGCHRPAAWCEIDHITQWPHGPTDVSNGRLLCLFHHRLRHDGWTLTANSDGTYTPRAPDDWPERLARRRRKRTLKRLAA